MTGKRKRGRQKKRWEDNIKEWTGMDFASSTWAAENRSRWKGIVANSSVVPRNLPRLWDRIENRITKDIISFEQGYKKTGCRLEATFSHVAVHFCFLIPVFLW